MSLAGFATKQSGGTAKAKNAAHGALGSLRIGEPDDAYEREADRVADEVMSGGALKHHWSLSGMGVNAPLQRKCSCGGSAGASECEECKKKEVEGGQMVQRTAAGPSAGTGVAPPIVNEVLNSPGQPLDRATRDFFEPKFGYDFSGVRVHNDALAQQSSRELGARAYSTGGHLIFGERKYDPQSWNGRTLIAHELAHVIQQEAQGEGTERAPAGIPHTPLRSSKVGPGHQPAGVHLHAHVGIQRQADNLEEIRRRIAEIEAQVSSSSLPPEELERLQAERNRLAAQLQAPATRAPAVASPKPLARTSAPTEPPTAAEEAAGRSDVALHGTTQAPTTEEERLQRSDPRFHVVGANPPSGESEFVSIEQSVETSAAEEEAADEAAAAEQANQGPSTGKVVLETAAGIAYGTIQSLAPGGFLAPSPAPENRRFEFFRAAGQIATGAAEMFLGLGGEVLGVGLDVTGIGAAVGVPVNIVSAGVIEG